MEHLSPEKLKLYTWIWIGMALFLFPILLKVTQPYGKHTKNTWGPMISNKVGWIIMELPALSVFMYFALQSNFPFYTLVTTAIVLWGMHYLHRALIFPFTLHTKGKKMPLLIVLFAIFFNTINGFLNGYWLMQYVPAESGILLNIRIVAGVIVFVVGTVINKYHDNILIKLRKTSENSYKIPYGGWFKYVSCPNFLGEIITWTGFFMLTLSLPAFSFLVWTLVNLGTRAMDHHKWYKNTFPDYPKERKAILPFIL